MRRGVRSRCEWAKGRTGEWAKGRTGERAIRGLNRVVRRDRTDVAGLNRRFALSPIRRFAAFLLAPSLTVPSAEQNPPAIGQF
jgi:hypothetical protein